MWVTRPERPKGLQLEVGVWSTPELQVFSYFSQRIFAELEVAEQINPRGGDIREADAKWVLGKKLGVTVCQSSSSLFILFSH